MPSGIQSQLEVSRVGLRRWHRHGLELQDHDAPLPLRRAQVSGLRCQSGGTRSAHRLLLGGHDDPPMEQHSRGALPGNQEALWSRPLDLHLCQRLADSLRLG